MISNNNNNNNNNNKKESIQKSIHVKCIELKINLLL